MIRINLRKPKPLESVGFTRADMLKLGAKGIDSIQRRSAMGLNANDRAAKPLGKKYRGKKEKMGKPGIRDLMFSGAMLGAMTVVEATKDSVTISFTRREELVKAIANDNRDRWFAFSKNDEAKVTLLAEQILQRKVKA